MQVDNISGSRITPANVMSAIRKHLGIENANQSSQFTIDEFNTLDLFNSHYATPYS